MATTTKMLELLVSRMNQVTGSPAEPWVQREDGIYAAQIGNYHLDGSYGKTQVCRMYNIAGGVQVVFPLSTKRELESLIRAWLDGYQAAH